MTKQADPRTKREDLRFWMNSLVDARTAVTAAILNYGGTPAQVDVINALNAAISEYRHRMHDLTEDLRA